MDVTYVVVLLVFFFRICYLVHMRVCFRYYTLRYTRFLYDDLSLRNGPTFDQHRDEVHSLWKYVYFFHYLGRKVRSKKPLHEEVFVPQYLCCFVGLLQQAP